MHRYWKIDSTELDHASLEPFNGVEAAKIILENLRMQLSHSEMSDALKMLIARVRTLYKFEQDFENDSNVDHPAEFYRKRAYHLLDWIPAFSGMVNSQVMVNLFLRLEIYLQIASLKESVPAVKMADEQLALDMCLTAFTVAHHATPDVELYAYAHGLRLLSAFQYRHPQLLDVVKAFQHQALKIADLFPFFESISPNVDFFAKGQQTIGLMRGLLHVLIQIIKSNRAGEESIPIDHDYITVLYQAYEACLKDWYEETHDPENEQGFKVLLMNELLFKNGWTFLELEQNLNSPWIMIDRDEEGWMVPSPSLPWKNTPSIETYRSLNGLELNYHTGQMRFLFQPVAKNDPSYTQVISSFDLSEMLEKNISEAIFSLDPVDPDMLYHPFNKMRFAPTSVYKTEFLNTMLLTDYLLKFFTVAREAQSEYPYATRELDLLTSHLPLYLKKIISDFHKAQQSESLHSFWIEACEVPVALDDESAQREGIQRIALGELKMTVKKYQMTRDADGNLVYTTEENEGWNFHVFPKNQMDWILADDHYRSLSVPSIVVIEGQNKIYFVDEEGISRAFSLPLKPKAYQEKLMRLSKLKRETNGEVLKTSQNDYWLYKLTRDITRHCNKSHRFSPEYVFAQEFTAHYDEFAQYYPEFGRLRELSRITVLIKFMNGLREGYKENLARLEDALNDVPHWQTRANEINRAIQQARNKYTTQYDQEHMQVLNQLKAEFDQLSREISGIYEKKAEAEKQIQKAFSDQNKNDVSAALKNDSNAIARIARNVVDKKFSQYKSHVETEVREAEQVVPNEKKALRDKRDVCARIEKTFKDLRFGADVPETEEEKKEQEEYLSKQCFWVLSSVCHHPKGSLARTIYGGVHVEPKVNVLLSGSSQHQNTMNSAFSGSGVEKKCYRIECNSTASELNICACRFKLAVCSDFSD